MTIELAAFGIGGFLIAVILIWRKLRLLDAKLGQMRAEITQLQVLESRRLLIAFNAKPNVNESNTCLENAAIESNAVVVANDDHGHARPSPGLDTGTSLAERNDLNELTSLVPLVQIEHFLAGQEEDSVPIAGRTTRPR